MGLACVATVERRASPASSAACSSAAEATLTDRAPHARTWSFSSERREMVARSASRSTQPLVATSKKMISIVRLGPACTNRSTSRPTRRSSELIV